MRQIRLVRNVRLGVKTLMLHRLRSLLTTLGVVFGVGSVIAMLAVGEGASQEAVQAFRKLGANIIIIESVKPTEDEAASRGQRSFVTSYGLLNADNQRLMQTMSTVRRTVPIRIVRKDGRLGERSMELRVVGTTPDWFDLVHREVIAGRVMHKRDMIAQAPVCVLTEHAARYLLVTEEAIGQPIRVGTDYFEVIGIVKSEDETGGGVQTPDLAIDAYIPLTTARRFGETDIRRSSGSFSAEHV